MKKLLYINACVRGEDSRTHRLASPILAELEAHYDIDMLDLTDASLAPIGKALFAARGEGKTPAHVIDMARRFAAADRIVIAAPFWDMSFPAILKVFFEHISLVGITFDNNPDGSTRGICQAKRLLLITTRGMEIEDGAPLEQATPYLSALGWLWGIPQIDVISAVGMDMCDEATADTRIADAIGRGITLCKEFIHD